ncbi:12494_t:CDS:2 [Entrophospora sp. SA101]|nr:12494_t:CDS:2 [Entrophospora sp. SA101]CAJ0850544.1 7662_t:CDS:2 [Entrophospora sp. SA101]CAJ0861520.1 8251_t:CDS:2 [Entrophospora sp. SA101]CAJ0883561.1 2238_t:CDS:2 [Entrophospora sp. SA101]
MENFTPNFHQILSDNKVMDEGFPPTTSTIIGSLRNEMAVVPDNSIMSYATSDLPINSPSNVNNNNIITSTTASGSNSLASAINSTATTATSNMTEFTKRKNWSQKIIEELKDFLHVISPTGKLMYCSPSSTELVGYSPEELVNHSITEFIHVDDIDMFVRDFQIAIQNRTSFTIYYRFRKKDEKYITLEVKGHPYFGENDITGQCKCFFSMGRPYPSKTTAMIDSFLELKVENENLRRQLRELIEEKSVADDILVSTNNSLELLTGLRYQEGERAMGISNGSNNPRLLNEDLMESDTLATSLSARNDQTSKTPDVTTTNQASSRPRKKKKQKVEEEEYVCTDCGTVESPEWRKGPLGPKTLCNACGLRWAKKTKKQASGVGISGNNNNND